VKSAKGLNASLVDMGNRFRMIVNEVEAVDAPHELPKLPVARVMWKPLPDMKTGCGAWILAGGSHHTCFSQNLSTTILNDFASIAGIESVNIDGQTTIRNLQNELKWSEVYYKVFDK
jgi:L-arabinose isomerase